MSEQVETPTTPIADVVDGILDELDDHPLMSGVDCRVSWPGIKQKPESVSVGEVNSTEQLGPSSGVDDLGLPLRTFRTETTQVVWWIELRTPGQTDRHAFRRIAEIQAAFQDVIANAPNRAGLVDWIEIASKDHHVTATKTGVLGFGRVVVSYQCSLT